MVFIRLRGRQPLRQGGRPCPGTSNQGISGDRSGYLNLLIFWCFKSSMAPVVQNTAHGPEHNQVQTLVAHDPAW